jgi:hypothetical protein
MPNTYVAHGFDLADPWVSCGDAPQTRACPGCDVADADFDCLQKWYMGPGIHPRLKKPFGQRLAAAALGAVYGVGGPTGGPALAGCTATSDALTLHFDGARLAGAPLALRAGAPTAFSALVNDTDGVPASGAWVPLELSLAGGADVRVDLAPLRGRPVRAIKYAWGKTGGRPDSEGDVWCCAAGTTAAECTPGACPLVAALARAPFGGLPADPFLAQVRGGKCVCPAPQTCDA